MAGKCGVMQTNRLPFPSVGCCFHGVRHFRFFGRESVLCEACALLPPYCFGDAALTFPEHVCANQEVALRNVSNVRGCRLSLPHYCRVFFSDACAVVRALCVGARGIWNGSCETPFGPAQVKRVRRARGRGDRDAGGFRRERGLAGSQSPLEQALRGRFWLPLGGRLWARIVEGGGAERHRSLLGSRACRSSPSPPCGGRKEVWPFSDREVCAWAPFASYPVPSVGQRERRGISMTARGELPSLCFLSRTYSSFASLSCMLRPCLNVFSSPFADTARLFLFWWNFASVLILIILKEVQRRLLARVAFSICFPTPWKFPVDVAFGSPCAVIFGNFILFRGCFPPCSPGLC